MYVAEGRIQLTGWRTARRVIFTRTLLGALRVRENAELWDRNKHKFAVHITYLKYRMTADDHEVGQRRPFHTPNNPFHCGI